MDETKFEMSPPYLFMTENSIEYLFAHYGDASISCKWESNNEDVATVEDGCVSAKKVGRTIITATTEDGKQVMSLVIVDENTGEKDTPNKTDDPIVSSVPNQTQTATPTPDVSASSTTATPTKETTKKPTVKINFTKKTTTVK